ncbi:MAG: hypothetical protein QOC82_736 [Frankiaceae bacterium]|jgi:hypothetical protein|nr:hypothetical protein [Frankiaceae bacterium]
MSDDTTGVALRDHLDEVLAGVTPSPTLLDDVRAAHHRRSRRRATVVAFGSALGTAAATAIVVWGPTFAGAPGDGGGHRHSQPAPLASPSYSSPSYPPPQPREKWFHGPYAYGRPTSDVATFPLAAREQDPANSRRTLLVWYAATEAEYCVRDILQSPDDPYGDADGRSGGGCTLVPAQGPTRTNVRESSETCTRWAYVVGMIAPDTARVEARGIGGPTPAVTVRQIRGAPAPVFVVVDASAPTFVFRYLDAAGHQVGYRLMTHHIPGGATRCVPTVPTPTPSG